MSTTLIQSERFANIEVVTSLVINESNNASTFADDETPTSGLFITPSKVAGRLADVTGFPLVADNDQGKVEYVDPNVFGNSILLTDFSDVNIVSPASGNYLQYDGDDWVNAVVDLADLADVDVAGVVANSLLTFGGADWIDSATVSLSGNITVNGNSAIGNAPAIDTIGFWGAGVIRPAVSTSAANFNIGTSNIVAGDATYEGYTVGGLVLNLQAVGLLA